MVTKRCLVSGRVQGVFYRVSTAEQARRLGITGYAKNLPDGRVEVLACGEAAKVSELIEWLRKGPPAAQVSDVDVQDADAARAPKDFSTR
ncbi:MAG TPA: acylphosphatase [Gammaproteobacteria bacterium]|jgi:acylphosphatase